MQSLASLELSNQISLVSHYTQAAEDISFYKKPPQTTVSFLLHLCTEALSPSIHPYAYLLVHVQRLVLYFKEK